MSEFAALPLLDERGVASVWRVLPGAAGPEPVEALAASDACSSCAVSIVPSASPSFIARWITPRRAGEIPPPVLLVPPVRLLLASGFSSGRGDWPMPMDDADGESPTGSICGIGRGGDGASWCETAAPAVTTCDVGVACDDDDGGCDDGEEVAVFAAGLLVEAPEKKKRDLRRCAACVLDTFPPPTMLLLFGLAPRLVFRL